MPPIKVTITGLDRVGVDRVDRGTPTHVNKAKGGGGTNTSTQLKPGNIDLRNSLSRDKGGASAESKAPVQLFTKKRPRLAEDELDNIRMGPEFQQDLMRDLVFDQKQELNQLQQDLAKAFKESQALRAQIDELCVDRLKLTRTRDEAILKLETAEDFHAKERKSLQRELDMLKAALAEKEADMKAEKEERSKANKYIKELSDDLRDAQLERRQLVKMLERYTIGSGGSGREGRTDGYVAQAGERYPAQESRGSDWDARQRDRSRERAPAVGGGREAWKDRDRGLSSGGEDRGRDRGERSERLGRDRAGDGDM